MGLILVVLVLALVFGGLGFAAHILWLVAVILFIFYVIGFALGRGASAGTRRWWRR